MKKHQTAVVTTPWDGAKAIMEAKTPEALLHMHAYFQEGADPAKRESYLFPHHDAGTDTPANLTAVNLALARLCEADLPEAERLEAAAHLRAHRVDAGLPETMSEAEVAEAVKYIKKVDDLKAKEARTLTEAIHLQEGLTLVETIDLQEAGDGSLFMPLVEKAVRRDGSIPIKIIQPGWGSSGYYPAEVLERDGPKIFTKGMHMYWNHPTQSEEAERPERSLNDLAGVLLSDARWDANGSKGPGLYADAKVFENYRSAVDDMAEHIGVSIRAMGKAQQGTLEGRRGPLITELTAGRSTDFVTAPGAGGEIITLFEAARKVRTDQDPDAGTDPAPAATDSVATTESNMEEAMEMKELQEAVTTLQTQNASLTANNARMAERLAMREARDLVQEALSGLQLPQTTKTRLLQTLPAQFVMKEGELDQAAFKALVNEAVKTEVKYLTDTLGLGNIKGLGEAASDGEEDGEGEPENVEEALAESFAAIGLSESAAKIAAQGRK